MRAVVCTGFEESEVTDVARPTPTETEVLVAVERVQLSVTECQLYRGAEIRHHGAVEERMGAGGARLFGHEFCGEVVETGDAVTRLAGGERVYAPKKPSCGACAYCRRGYPHFCDDQESIGYDRPGALAEYVAVPAEALVELPSRISDAEGAAMQPLASAVVCALDAGISPGDAVAVIGTGVMGYQCAQLAALFGATQIFAVDVRTRPLGIAAGHGMRTVDARETDPVETVRVATDGIGADVVFETAGGDQRHGTTGSDPLAQAHRMIRNGGTIVQVGHIAGDVSITPRTSRSKSVSWVNPRRGVVPVGPNATTGEIGPELVAGGAVSIAEYVTHRVDSLDDFERAVDITLEKREYDALGPAQIVVAGGE